MWQMQNRKIFCLLTFDYELGFHVNNSLYFWFKMAKLNKNVENFALLDISDCRFIVKIKLINYLINKKYIY